MEVQQWLDVPGFRPLYGEVDVASLTLGLTLVQLHGVRLAHQRFDRPLASGGVVLGTPLFTVRATYLLDRRTFLVESGGHPGAPWHANVPVDLKTLIAYLVTWLHTDYGDGFTFSEYETFEGDPQTNLFWSQAYGRLLGLPSPTPGPAPPRTIEQQRIDALVQRNHEGWLLPEIERLTGKLQDHLATRPSPRVWRPL